MAGFMKFRASVMAKIDWLKSKLKRRSVQASPEAERKLVIGNPTNFRREELTLGVDCQGKHVLVEKAQEDAQSMHAAAKAASSPVV
ncbi:hypothetical protein PV04_08754 [Phialophora macrospora]|uniref:Uncharacterized protein n=1 Tax=Phialophora macrospora TaxID=1851006 RepID=A0A0D2DNB4_9EURO|nr:hypothetical protein PV04_08754 [Phialophora macrospora]